MFLMGTIVGTIVVLVAEFFSVSGWIAGPVFAAFVLIFIYANDRLMGFVMKHVINLIAKLGKTDITDPDKKQIEKSFTLSSDYFGFLAGTVIGVLASLFGVPSRLFDWLPF